MVERNAGPTRKSAVLPGPPASIKVLIRPDTISSPDLGGPEMRRRKFLGLVLLLMAVAPSVALSSDVRVLSGSGVQPAMNEIVPQFERTSGHRVSMVYSTVGEMAGRVQNGEVADMVIASGPQIESLEKLGRVVAGTRTDLAKTGVGLFVRKGASKPDISSVEAFKRTMLASKSIGWNDPAAGAPVSIYMLGAFERMGIANEMKEKTTAFRQRSERFEAVARGDVEIGFNQISEIVAASGVDLLGPLPPAIQHYTLFTAGIVASSANQEAAKALLAFIASPAAKAIMHTKGFESP
jgi:molybdate transport system substrate-binding protein